MEYSEVAGSNQRVRVRFIMQLDLDNLPSDTVLLHRLVRDMASVVERRDGEIERLQLIIQQLQRARFGRRSERIDAAPVERCARGRRRSARSQAGWRLRRCSRRSWSANIAITRHCTGNRKSLRVTALSSIARRWPAGSAAPAGGSTRCTKGSARM